MKKEKIILASMLIAMPVITFTYHYAPEQYTQTLSPQQIKELQCKFKKIYKAGHRINSTHPISKLLAIKEPYNTWPKARRLLLRKRLENMKKVVDNLMDVDPYQADALENLHIRMRALNNGYTYRR